MTIWEREQDAEKIQREEVLLWGVSGSGYLSSICPTKEKRETEQADIGDPTAAEPAAHRGAASSAAAYQFHGCRLVRHIDL